MTTDPSNPRDSRRVPLEARVHLKFERFTGFISEYSSNISPGGMFIRTQSPEPVGTMLEFQCQLGDGYELIRGTGEVVWTRAADESPERPAGMGIRFLRLSKGSRELIYKMVDAHIAQGGTPFDLTSASPAAPAAVPDQPAEASAPGPMPLPPVPAAPPRPATAEISPELAAFLEPPPAPDAEPPAEAQATAVEPAAAWEASVPALAFAEERPARKRVRPMVWIAAALVVAIGGAAVWFAEPLRELAGLAADPATDVPVPARAEEPVERVRPTAVAKQGGTLPAAVEQPPAPAMESAGGEAVPAPTASVPQAREIQKITWREADDETELILWGDGAIGAQAYSRSRVDGGPPRELIRLYGIDRPFPMSRLPVGTTQLVQVRTGYHPKPAANELHVVLDLADPAVAVSQVEEQGTRLHIHLRRK